MNGQASRITTSHWGAFRVDTDGDRIVDVAPFAADPEPSAIPTALPAAVHHDSRVKRPSVRRGWLDGGSGRERQRRGDDEFVELGWDEALDLAAAEIERVRREHGNGSIFGGSYGWASAGRFHHALGQVHRFLNVNGGYVSSFGSYSTAAAQAIMPHVLGMNFLKLLYANQNQWSMIAEHTQTLVMFGGINRKNSQVSMGGVTRHQTGGWIDSFADAGMRLINISPQRSDTTDRARWMPIIPGSDTAMMLALAHVLESENLVDREFVKRCCVGYERFRDYLLGEVDAVAKTPEWASTHCGIEATQIRELARTMASGRTLITIAWSLQRAQNGEQPYWMGATLAAMLGQIGLPGGGIGYGYGAIGGVGVPTRRLTGLTLPQGQNPITDFIPVARIADMLLQPGEQYDFNGQRRTYPDIRLVYWCGGNPFHHHQDLNRLNEAWKQPDTVIVHEPWWTATARRADIVFPATTPYEREDIGRTDPDPFLFHMPRLIPPQHEARDDYDIFSELSARLGTAEAFTEGRDAGAWIEFLYNNYRDNAARDGVEIPSLSKLRELNWVELPVDDASTAKVPFKDFREDPSKAPLGTPSGRIEIFSETIDGFDYDDAPGHPSWQEPQEWLGGEKARQYPLHLVSPQPADKLHSQLESGIADRPGARPVQVTVNTSDAEKRGIEDGNIVRVFNDRGACLARAQVSDAIRVGVISMPTGAWYDPGADNTDRQGNPNVLTRDIGSSRIGQGSSAHTTLVDLVRLSDD